MKKTKLLLIFLLCMFILIGNVKAFKWECNDLDVNIGDDVTCKLSEVDIENSEEIYIYSQLEIYESNVSNPAKKDGEITFSTSKVDADRYNVTAESNLNGVKTKTINVKSITTKKTTTTTKKKSSNNYLTTIIIDDNQIEGFSKDKTKYYVSVANEVNKVKIDVRVEDENATYDINGPQMLEVGDNEYTIGVTSEDNTTRFYKVIITRKEEDASSNTNISSIKISGYKFNLDGYSKTYHLKINEDDDKLNVKVELEDENASYEIEGNSNLRDGSIIKIVITAENGDIDTYRIIISKDEKTNYLMYIIIGISILVISLLIIFIVFKKNNRKNVKKKDNKISDNERNNFHKDSEKDVDLEKTIEISSLNDNGENIDNDENEETRMLPLEENVELEKTKVIELDSETEINKAFEDTFD